MPTGDRTSFNAILFALVVVRENDRYLLVEEQEPDGRVGWYLPAGGVEAGEDFVAAAVREAEEESGLIIEPIGILGMDQSVFTDGIATKIRVVLMANPIGGELKSVPDEHSLQAAWFSLSEIESLPLRHPEVAQWIRVAEELQDTPLPSLTVL